MLRPVITALVCWLAFFGQSFGQEIFVPRELKAQPVHPPGVKAPAAETKTAPPKEVVRRAEAVTPGELKAPVKEPSANGATVKTQTPKADALAAKTEKAPAPKEKSAPPVKPAVVKEESPGNAVAKAEPASPKTDKASAAKSKTASLSPNTQAEAPAVKKEKVVSVKEEPAPDKAIGKTEVVKTESPKAVTTKTEPASKAVAKTEAVKTESPKEKAEKAATAKTEPASKAVAKTEAAKTEPPKDKVEKAVTAKTEPASKAVAKTEAVKTEPPKEKAEKATVKTEPASKAVAKTEAVKTEPPKEKGEKAVTAKTEPASKAVVKTDAVKVETITAKTEKPAAKEESAGKVVAKTHAANIEPEKGDKPVVVKDKPASAATAKAQTEKADLATAKKEKVVPALPAKDEAASKAIAKAETAKPEPATPKTEKVAVTKDKSATAATKPQVIKPESLPEKAEKVSPVKQESPAVVKTLNVKAEPVSVTSLAIPPPTIPVTSSFDTAFTKIADGFDFPVGKPEAEGYYRARGYRVHGHMGEDWDGIRGGDTDLKDPIYSIGDGIVVFARDVHLGWGNVIIVRHAYRESGTVKYIDALYGHLNTMLVGRGQKVARGQQIGTMGTAHGQYDAHLHLEIRKNLEIGMSRSKFQKDFSNYYDPSKFIASHRRLSGGGTNYRVAMNTFTHDGSYHFDTARNFSARKRSTGESSAALKRAITTR